MTRKCEEHNDQNTDCPICYPPVGDPLIDVRINSLNKRIDALWDAVEQIRQMNDNLVKSVESLREAIT